jgi:hypothetical protein
MGGIFTLMVALKFMLSCLGILAIIYVFLLLTPKIAKAIDTLAEKHEQKHPKPPEDERMYLVRSPFDGTHELDMEKLKTQEEERQRLAKQSSEGENTLENVGDVKENG